MGTMFLAGVLFLLSLSIAWLSGTDLMRIRGHSFVLGMIAVSLACGAFILALQDGAKQPEYSSCSAENPRKTASFGVAPRSALNEREGA